MVTINISMGELFDRMSILEIKLAKINDRSKLRIVEEELEKLKSKIIDPMNTLMCDKNKVWDLYDELYEVNLDLWNIEDRLRYMESIGDFSMEFISTARLVYKYNDRRYELKCLIDIMFGEGTKEVKYFTTGKK